MRNPNPLDHYASECKNCSVVFNGLLHEDGYCWACEKSTGRDFVLAVIILIALTLFALAGCQEEKPAPSMQFAQAPIGYTDFVKFTQENK